MVGCSKSRSKTGGKKEYSNPDCPDPSVGEDAKQVKAQEAHTKTTGKAKLQWKTSIPIAVRTEVYQKKKKKKKRNDMATTPDQQEKEEKRAET